MTSSEPDGRGVRIPPGAFQMGSNDGAEDQRPVHTVFLDGLFIDRYPVTNGQFARFARETGYLTDAERGGTGLVRSVTVRAPVASADWRHPEVPTSDIAARADCPVV
jgi:formylglycine-generating enzyme